MKTPPSLIPPTRHEQDLDDHAYFAQRIDLIMERKTAAAETETLQAHQEARGAITTVAVGRQ